MSAKRHSTMILVFFFCYAALGCDGCDNILGFDQRLKIVNNSDKRIYFDAGFTYPDTALKEYNPAGSFAENGAKPHSQEILGIQGRWEERFEDLPADTLMIFIFDADTLEQVPWDKVRSEYKILKRYDLSLQDLKDRDWKVVYP